MRRAYGQLDTYKRLMPDLLLWYELQVISYGLAGLKYTFNESEFVHDVNRLNVAITRARAKSVAFLPHPLLDSLPRILEMPEAERGLAYIRGLVGVTAA